LKTGDSIRFKAVDVSEAHEILKIQERSIIGIIEGFNCKRFKEDKNLRLSINNKSFEVKVNEVKICE
jgi:hypothetical protein